MPAAPAVLLYGQQGQRGILIANDLLHQTWRLFLSFLFAPLPRLGIRCVCLTGCTVGQPHPGEPPLFGWPPGACSFLRRG